ncbi:HNH endonuclease signature motif containing protein [uncultured Vibrio sp.]|uniref:HNH endonuclease n=1 Tax=uncultured Vibrio sp. TaxID=114054 RepID=UPI0025F8CCDD|nr:HNH endonuclease signature motif containing protein [uncultured Vibrio sp.]
MQRYWLLLEKTPEKISTPNIAIYNDITGKEYSYDDSVPNHKSLSPGDYVVLRKDNSVVGSAIVESINTAPSFKVRYRCPNCNSTNIERKKRADTWVCNGTKRAPCTYKGQNIVTSNEPVTKYTALLKNFILFCSNEYDVATIKQTAIKPRSQLSIKELDREAIESVVRLPTLSQIEIRRSGNSKRARESRKPDVYYEVVRRYHRNQSVIADALERSNGICEECGKIAPFNRKSDNTKYLEVHHVIPLSENGDDTIDNVLALCPNCHREKHYG